MDLGCLDLGCIEKQSNEVFLDSENSGNDSVTATSKVGKNKALKEAGQSNLSALNKFTSQIKKPPHRKSSPLNWFPRKKVDSYLKRKIKLLQEVGGLHSTLDETLGDSNPHYSRVLKEKMAVKEAAIKAMEARKAEMVEASWCRILRAARIQTKEAEALLLEAERIAAEAFEAAKAIGVIMYDIPECSQKHYEIETSSANGGSTTHTVTTSFETAFEVDKQVATAVKTALIRLANCPSINKDEFKELLRKISQNPENNQELSEFSSECESDSGTELDPGLQKTGLSSQEAASQRKYKKRQISEKFKMTKLVDMMLERLRCLQEDELASLATIVATCGLSAALTEAENSKKHDLGSSSVGCISAPALNKNSNVGYFSNFTDGQMRRKQVEAELPSLDKFLVKHLTKLEKEVQEAKDRRRNEDKEGNCEKKKETERVNLENYMSSAETTPDLGSILVKHSSKLEKEIEKAKTKYGNSFEMKRVQKEEVHDRKQDVSEEVPSLDKFLVKHVSKLEREVMEAKNGRKIESIQGERVDLKKKASSTVPITQSEESACSSNSDSDQAGKENIDLNEEITLTLPIQSATRCSDESLIQIKQENSGVPKETENSLDKILVKPVHRLEREKIQALSMGRDYKSNWCQKNHLGGSNVTEGESLDKVLVKHVSRLEREKMGLGRNEEVVKVNKRRDTNTQWENSESGLGQILVKHKSRLEREKMAAAQQPDNEIRHSVTRREAREREMQDAWGGLSLGNSMCPHLSRLQRDKADWLKAEEDERRRALEL